MEQGANALARGDALAEYVMDLKEEAARNIFVAWQLFLVCASSLNHFMPLRQPGFISNNLRARR